MVQVHDTASFQACERAVSVCARRGGCAAHTPARFKLNGAVGNSLFFVNMSPYLSRMTSMVATVLRYYCPLEVCAPWMGPTHGGRIAFLRIWKQRNRNVHGYTQTVRVADDDETVDRDTGGVVCPC